MQKYYEIAEFRASNRNRLISVENMKKLIEGRGKTSPLFRSVFWYDEGLLDHLKANKSVALYRGLRGIDSIPIDIDKKSNSDEYTLEKLREYLERLDKLSVKPEAYQIYFSGTGYHIFVDNSVFNFTPGIDIARQVALTMYNLNLIDDPAAIRASQLIRLEHSLNEKSKLYKVPLTYEEATTLEAKDILLIAKHQRLGFEYEEKYGTFQLEEYVVAEEQFESAEKTMQSEGRFNSLYAVCIQTLWSQGPKEGTRNNSILRIASHFKRQGIPEEACLFAMQGWNTKTKQSLDPKIVESKVRTVYNSPYRYGCSDELLKKHCHRSCLFYKNKNMEKSELMKTSDLDKAMEERLEMMANKDQYLNLKDVFGLDVDCVLYPGELVVFIGDTGTNKTSIIQNIMLGVDMVNDVVRPPGLPIIYYGPELHAGTLQMRNYCIVTGHDEESVIRHQDELHRHRSALEHIAVQQEALTLPGIEKLIRENQPRVLVIDYYEQVEHSAWDRSPTVAIAEIAKSLSAMAVKYGIIIIAISQANREAAKNGLGVHSGFGSGAIEKTARRLFIIEGEQDSPYRTISQVKANSDPTWKGVVLERQDNWRFKRIK